MTDITTENIRFRLTDDDKGSGAAGMVHRLSGYGPAI